MSEGTNGNRYTAGLVAQAFSGTAAFGPGVAAKVAAALNAIDGIDTMHPDAAGKAAQAAITAATRGKDAERGAIVSIDAAIAALAFMDAQLAIAGSSAPARQSAPASSPAGAGAAGPGGTS